MWKIYKGKSRIIFMMVLLLGGCFAMRNAIEQHALEATGYELAEHAAPETGLKIKSTYADPSIRFSTDSKKFKLAYHKDQKSFKLSSEKFGPLVTMNKHGIYTNNLVCSMKEPEVMVELKSHSEENWKLLETKFFNTYPSEYITRCQDSIIVGGVCKTSDKELSLQYKIPKHTMIRVVANYHFFDVWSGNVGYIKANGQFIWSENLDTRGFKKGKNALKICGKSVNYRFSQGVDVSLEHFGGDLKLVFGSSLRCHPCDGSYGISNVQIFYK